MPSLLALAQTYAGMLVAFLVIDLTWITVVAKNFYFGRLGHLLAEKPVLTPAIVFYTMYLAGILYLVVLPAVKSGSLISAGLGGAILGLLCYATYDLTNHATMRAWPWQVTVVDMLWGMLLTAAIALVGYSILTRIS